MAVTTITGSGATTTLVLSTATAVALTQNATTNLMQAGAVTVTGTGRTVLFLVRTSSTNNPQCQVNVLIDGSVVASDVAGTQIIYRQVLAVGSHTIDFNVYSFGAGTLMNAAGLTVLDLGL